MYLWTSSFVPTARHWHSRAGFGHQMWLGANLLHGDTVAVLRVKCSNQKEGLVLLMGSLAETGAHRGGARGGRPRCWHGALGTSSSFSPQSPDNDAPQRRACTSGSGCFHFLRCSSPPWRERGSVHPARGRFLPSWRLGSVSNDASLPRAGG